MKPTRGSKVTVTCANPACAKQFEARKSDVDRGWAKCCSKSCSAAARGVAEPAPIQTIHPGGIVSRDQQSAVVEMDAAIAKAIDAAKQAGVPQGLIVATLHGHAAAQTLIMIEK